MRLPRLAPRIAISLPLSGLLLAARAAEAGMAGAAVAAALMAAMVTPAAGAGAIGGSAALAAFGAMLWAGATPALPAALPLAGNLALAWHFGRTLRAGQDPLILRYTRADIGIVPPALMGYTRRLTCAWAAFFLVFAAVNALTLVGAGPPAGMSAAINLGASVLFFLGEHAVRARRFPELAPVRPARTLRAIWRADAEHHAR